jgi:hypothetical protein
MARPAQPAPSAGAPLRAPPAPDGEPAAVTARIALFDAPHAPASPPAPARPARLRGRLQALLARSPAVAREAPPEPRPAWPDSFFDVDGQP